MAMRTNFKYLKEKEQKELMGAGNPLYNPWGTTDIISSNCLQHIGVRLARIDDGIYQCPIDKRIYKTKGSVSHQTDRDNHYLGQIIK